MKLILQYKLKLRFDMKLHEEKMLEVVEFANKKKITIQFSKFENLTYVYIQINRSKQKYLRDWEVKIKEKIRKTFYRVPYEMVNLIEIPEPKLEIGNIPKKEGLVS